MTLRLTCHADAFRPSPPAPPKFLSLSFAWPSAFLERAQHIIPIISAFLAIGYSAHQTFRTDSDCELMRKKEGKGKKGNTLLKTLRPRGCLAADGVGEDPAEQHGGGGECRLPSRWPSPPPRPAACQNALRYTKICEVP